MLKSSFASSLNTGVGYYLFFIPLLWLLAAVLPLLPLWQNLERQLFDVFSVLSMPQIANSPIVIVEIDQPSISALNLQLPWPRGIYGSLVERLDAAGAAVIGLDVVFAGDSLPEEDLQLAQAISAANSVVLAADIEQSQRQQFNLVEQVNPAQQFLDAGGLPGLAIVELDGDNRLRRVPTGGTYFWQQLAASYAPQSITLDAFQSDESRWIRYLLPTQTFTYFSVYQVLQGLVPASNFRDKIVLVGLNLKTQAQPGEQPPDTFLTPVFYQEGPTTGVEVQAILASNALAQTSIQLTSGLSSYLLSLMFVSLGAASLRSWQPLASTLLALALLLAVLLVTYFLFAAFDQWYQSAAVLLSLFLFYLGRGGWANFRDYRQKQFLKSSFERYLSPQLIQQMLNDPDAVKLGGERKKLTILFTDLAGFTSLSEKLTPERVASFLNQHLDVMTRLVFQHGGTIDKFIGDSVMAFWGAPLADDQQELKACRCALAMAAAMDSLAVELGGDEFPDTAMRIGVNTGEVIVGNMGSNQRFDYTAIGDEVNLASRLEGINKLYGTSILISEAVRAGLDDELETLRIDRVIVKGQTRPVDIYTLGAMCRLRHRIESAIDYYVRREWQASRELWLKLQEEEEIAMLASVYLSRLERLQANPPDADWRGEIALEKL
ncbi:MAG: adenylate/guanylate cyclase domain-containing protein [Proteobacteria bacterium]|nr:adenylate/guanylate cyclase domain-containing protein [Pseudomonadota bacterium]